jgi:hypothetical protein
VRRTESSHVGTQAFAAHTCISKARSRSHQSPSSIPSIRVLRACHARVGLASASSPFRARRHRGRIPTKGEVGACSILANADRRFGRAPAASSAAQDCCIRRTLEKSSGARTATPSRRGDSGRRSVGRSGSERRGDVLLAEPQRCGAPQAAIATPSRPGSAEQQSVLRTPRCCSRPNSVVRLRRTAPPARRSHSRRAIVPTAASRRCLCHGCGSHVACVVVIAGHRRVVRSAQPAASDTRPPARGAALPERTSWGTTPRRRRTSPCRVCGSPAPTRRRRQHWAP